jgi:hypothetical protein
MRTLKLGCLAAAALLGSGCFQMTTLVKVNGDGSGTIDHSLLVTKAALAQLRNFAALGRGGGGQAGIDLISEDQARAMAATLGDGVSYVSSEPIDTPLGQGRRATYSFTDITTVKISQQPETPGGIHVGGRGLGNGEITCSFTRQPDGTAVVHIAVPEMKMPELPMGPLRPGSAQAPNPALAQQFAMVRALLAGARVSIAMEPAGSLLRTNAPAVDGSRVTLLDVDVDQLLGNEEVFARLSDAKTPEDLKAVLKEVPGLKIPLERDVVVEFTPAK